MIDEKLDGLFFEIVDKCLTIVREKHISIQDVAQKMHKDSKELFENLEVRNRDFSIYLQLYDILCEW